jgi:hypothetical protein
MVCAKACFRLPYEGALGQQTVRPDDQGRHDGEDPQLGLAGHLDLLEGIDRANIGVTGAWEKGPFSAPAQAMRPDEGERRHRVRGSRYGSGPCLES